MKFTGSGHNQIEPTSVYVLESAGRVKIGIAASVKARLEALQLASPVAIVLRHERQFPTRTAARLVERSLHVKFATQRLHGEWFALEVHEATAALEAVEVVPEPVKIPGRLRTAPPPVCRPAPPRAAPRARRDDGLGPTWEEYEAMDDATWCDFMRPAVAALDFHGASDPEASVRLEAELRVKYPRYFARTGS